MGIHIACLEKGFDNYSLYAVEGFGMDEVKAARIAAIGAWMRPVAALGAGFLLDRSPGLAGHQHYFFFLAAFAAIGLFVSLITMRRLHK